jgi:hypothetical protein
MLLLVFDIRHHPTLARLADGECAVSRLPFKTFALRNVFVNLAAGVRLHCACRLRKRNRRGQGSEYVDMVLNSAGSQQLGLLVSKHAPDIAVQTIAPRLAKQRLTIGRAPDEMNEIGNKRRHGILARRLCRSFGPWVSRSTIVPEPNGSGYFLPALRAFRTAGRPRLRFTLAQRARPAASSGLNPAGIPGSSNSAVASANSLAFIFVQGRDCLEAFLIIIARGEIVVTENGANSLVWTIFRRLDERPNTSRRQLIDTARRRATKLRLPQSAPNLKRVEIQIPRAGAQTTASVGMLQLRRLCRRSTNLASRQIGRLPPARPSLSRGQLAG